jgi:cytochrome c oxidase subunit IV
MSDHKHTNAGYGEHRDESMTTYAVVFILLLVLLGLTYGAYQLDLGAWNLAIALIIAVIKAAMVLMVFMHVRLSPKIVWIFSLSSFLWLILMIAGFVNDYASRPLDGPDAHRFISAEAAAMRMP